MPASALIPQELLEEAIHLHLGRCRRFHVAMAIVRSSGLDLLLPHLRQALTRGAHGEVVVGIDLPSEPDALEALVALREEFEERFAVRRFASPKCRYFHNTYWVFTTKRPTAIIGSSNLTASGLRTNYEANVLLDGTAAADFGDYFGELFNGAYAHDVTRRWLKAYRTIWKDRRDNVAKAERLRTKALRTPADPRTQPVPNRVRGHKFVFTGRIVGWPRERRLYPWVRRLGGEIGLRDSAVPKAAALVQGEAMGNHDTLKLKTARGCGALILTQQEFFDIALRQERRRG